MYIYLRRILKCYLLHILIIENIKLSDIKGIEYTVPEFIYFKTTVLVAQALLL